MNIGEKVTISSWGMDRLPATVTSITKSGKTITVRKNKYESEKRNTGPMVLAITKVKDELDTEEIKFRFKSDGGYWVRSNHGYDTISNKTGIGWNNLSIDLGL